MNQSIEHSLSRENLDHKIREKEACNSNVLDISIFFFFFFFAFIPPEETRGIHVSFASFLFKSLGDLTQFMWYVRWDIVVYHK